MSGRRVLVIDVGLADYEVLASLLTAGGYEVLPLATPATTPAEAAALHPDLLLFNIQTPTGLERYRQLKSQPQLQQVPVIVILEQFEPDFAARCLELGIEDFILKPFQATEILPRLAVALRLREHELRLQAVQERYQRLFADSPEGFFVLDEAQRLVDANPAVRQLLGYDRPEDWAAITQVAELFYTPADYEKFRQALADAGQLGKLKVNLRHRSGRPVPVLLQGELLKGGGAGRIAVTDLSAVETAVPAHLPAHLQSLSGRPARKKSLLNLISRFLPFAGNILSVLKLTELIGGRYEKIKRLGQGSYGEVWLVADTEAAGEEQYYVAKIPFSRGYNKIFQREADICRKLSPHPGAVRLIDTLNEGGRLILIQEYVRGRTLQELLEAGELPPSWRDRIIFKVIDTVAFAHRLKIMHRDIKPNNIMIGPRDTVKLLDYGAAKELKDRDISATMIGSRPYMAPEQIMGRSELRSDVWALGVIMYLLFTGTLPFYEEVEKLLIDQILTREPVPPREENPELPLELEAIILKCLAKDPEQRYPDAGALLADLRQHFPDFGQQPLDMEL